MSRKPDKQSRGAAPVPPGRVGGLGHGADKPVETPYGVAHLREVMKLSADVPIERVCEDAAMEIERLTANQKPTAWPDED